MSKNIFGFYGYEHPLSKEEREIIIPHVDTEIKNKLKHYLSIHFKICLDVARLSTFSHKYPRDSKGKLASIVDNDKMIEAYLDEYKLRIRDAVREYGSMIPLLDKDELFEATFEVIDEVPVVKLTPLVMDLINKDIDFDINYDHVGDAELIIAFNHKASCMPELLIVKEEDKVIVDFNKQLELISRKYTNKPYVDFTDIIKEIAQAAKEGKL